MKITLTPAAKEDLRHVKPLYLSAFPREERAPFSRIKRTAMRKRGTLLIARDGEEFIGFLYLIEQGTLIYLFYLAIAESKRGSGYGGEVLEAVKELYRGKRLFLAREELDPTSDNYEQRLRRHEFDLRHGFEDQPLKIKEGPVVYDVMGIGDPATPEEYRALMLSWGGRLLPLLVDIRLFRA